jgi:peroxiredoxin Q/BCP
MDDLKIGDLAPNFSMITSDGTSINLESFNGKNLILYFYPKDNTPGCTLEGMDFSSLAADFAKHNTAVVGVSKDSIKSHCNFRDRFNLKIILASDEDGAVSKAYGVLAEKSMFGKKYLGINRTTFMIDPSGKISYIWPDVSVTGHASKVLEMVIGGGKK